jgi:hypothetical protein
MDRIRNFFSKTHLHGFAYLTDDEVKQFMLVRIFRKLFWGSVIILSFMGLSKFMYSTLEEYFTDIVIINVETSYLDWINTFPAISICFRKGYSTKPIQEVMTKYWEENDVSETPNDRFFWRTLQNYMFISSLSPIDNYNEACEDFNSTCGVDLDFLRSQLLPRNCNEFMYGMKLFGKKIGNCSEYFELHKTEVGYCFIANSIYGKNNMKYGFYNQFYDQSFNI